MTVLAEAFQSSMTFLWWLATPLQWIVKAKVIPEQVPSYLNLEPNTPVLYVMAKRSLSDLLVLYWHCKKLGLPLPTAKIEHLRRDGTAAYLYLNKLGLFQPIKEKNQPPPPLQKLCEHAKRDPQFKLQLVPVSIIWGRSPGTSEKSLFKLLFPDDEHAGVLQKFLIVLAQGRDSLVVFGKPISLREQVDLGEVAGQTARKLRRVMRIHFRSQRLMTLGPKQYDRNRVAASLLQSKAIQEAIDAEARRSNTSRDRLENKVRHYFREIMSSPMHSFVRFFDVILTFLWKKIYTGIVVEHGENLRLLADKYEIIYVPSHRSHLDYLVLPYEL